MHTIAIVLLLSSLVLAQASPAAHPSSATTSSSPVTSASTNELIIPAGTKVPLALKHAVSTKSAREGDSVYAETTFPVVLDNRVLIPAGTYVQGRITHVQRAGRIKGRAEVLMHFTTLIYPSGYTVLLPGAVENVPGAEKTSIKGGRHHPPRQANGSEGWDSRSKRRHRCGDWRLKWRRKRSRHRCGCGRGSGDRHSPAVTWQRRETGCRHDCGDGFSARRSTGSESDSPARKVGGPACDDVSRLPAGRRVTLARTWHSHGP